MVNETLYDGSGGSRVESIRDDASGSVVGVQRQRPTRWMRIRGRGGKDGSHP